MAGLGSAAVALVVALALAWQRRGRAGHAPPAWPASEVALRSETPSFPADFGVRRIALDPGHGAANNTGNVSCFCVDEQDYTLEAALALRDRDSVRTGHFDVRLAARRAARRPQGPDRRGRRVRRAGLREPALRRARASPPPAHRDWRDVSAQASALRASRCSSPTRAITSSARAALPWRAPWPAHDGDGAPALLGQRVRALRDGPERARRLRGSATRWSSGSSCSAGRRCRDDHRGNAQRHRSAGSLALARAGDARRVRGGGRRGADYVLR